MLIAQALVELLLLCLHLFASSVVGANQQVADDGVAIVAQSSDRHDGRKAAAILANVGQFIDIFDFARGLEYQRLEAGSDRRSQFLA